MPASRTPASIWPSASVRARGWRANLIGRYRRLLDDAADSPIVEDKGDRDQYFTGVVVGYRF